MALGYLDLDILPPPGNLSFLSTLVLLFATPESRLYSSLTKYHLHSLGLPLLTYFLVRVRSHYKQSRAERSRAERSRAERSGAGRLGCSHISRAGRPAQVSRYGGFRMCIPIAFCHRAGRAGNSPINSSVFIWKDDENVNRIRLSPN